MILALVLPFALALSVNKPFIKPVNSTGPDQPDYESLDTPKGLQFTATVEIKPDETNRNSRGVKGTCNIILFCSLKALLQIQSIPGIFMKTALLIKIALQLARISIPTAQLTVISTLKFAMWAILYTSSLIRREKHTFITSML